MLISSCFIVKRRIEEMVCFLNGPLKDFFVCGLASLLLMPASLGKNHGNDGVDVAYIHRVVSVHIGIVTALTLENHADDNIDV